MSVIHDAAVFGGYYSVGHFHDLGVVCDHDGCRSMNPAKRLQHFDDGVIGVLVESGGLLGRIAFSVDPQPNSTFRVAVRLSCRL
ncbi:hypothetical protein KUL25_08895 [Rhodobacteraceae bacterium N5(2021)]|uniref:Uncharacterized protein n=1 Tax=Gymnodinialimonas phycosphaerae TaxID=2841589 RepID=A0A975YHK6_9RHOB|nr:hypothetical protein [Gymnodinialimonas phycosphaerae]MBY4892878.1 hypothetical protein [Gymnodinialimonas phycosphaerae]